MMWGSIDVLPNGNIIIPHYQTRSICEYDPNGAQVKTFNLNFPNSVQRLPNGRTLATSYNSRQIVEFDLDGAAGEARSRWTACFLSPGGVDNGFSFRVPDVISCPRSAWVRKSGTLRVTSGRVAGTAATQSIADWRSHAERGNEGSRSWRFVSRIEMMRRLWLLSLIGCFTLSLTFLLGGDGGLFSRKPGAKIDPEDEAVLRRADMSLDGNALLRFLRKRILAEKDRPEVERLIGKLGASEYRIRQKAAQDLFLRGPAAIELLRAARSTPLDLETLRRIDSVIERILEKDGPAEVRAAAVRILAQLDPDGLAEALIGYLPFADHPRIIDEIRAALTKHAVRQGKADPHLLVALSDRSALRRAIASEALGRAAYVQQKDAVRKMLSDADATVRYRTARALALSKDKSGVPVLIDALTELPLNEAWQNEDFLLRLAGTTPPPAEPMGNAKDAREKCKAAWHAWWKMHADKIDLAKLEDDPKLLGRTLIVLLDEKMVLELGPDNRPRWELHDHELPARRPARWRGSRAGRRILRPTHGAPR